MMMFRTLLLTGAALMFARELHPQNPATGSIHGMIRGDDGRAVANAEISVRGAGAHTTRSDNSGRFSITTEAGRNAVSVRLLGRQPLDTSITVSAGATAELDVVLPRITSLDTVVTNAQPVDCRQATTLDGFNCRRQNASGIYLDQGDIARRKPYFLGDLFYQMPGMEVIPTKTGRSFRPKDYRTYCMVVLVNGRPGPSPTPEELLGVEVFEKYQDVPTAYRNFSWMPPGAKFPPDFPCVVVNLWTRAAARHP
jgi:hypothetical protein